MEPQFPILEITERNDYNSYRHMMFMMPILLDAHCIVETGLGHGHSTRIWLESLAQFPRDGKTRYLMTYEIQPMLDVLQDCQRVARELGVEFYCVEEAAVEALKHSKIFQPIDLLYLDSDHHYENVCGELEGFKPYLSSKAIILLDDAWSFGAPLEIPNYSTVYHTKHPGQNPSDVYYAAKEWADKNGWKTMLFTETRGLAPEAIATNGKMILHRN
jgi:cephalosporin hydroxylase